MSLTKIQFRIVSISMFLFLGVIFNIAELRAQNNIIPLIPLPKNVQWSKGNFLLSEKTRIIGQSSKLQGYLISQINTFTGLTLLQGETGQHGSIIVLKIDSSMNMSNNESYILEVSKAQITISSTDEEGLFRGLQTLFQLVPPYVKTFRSGISVVIPCCTISDQPEFH